jgi:polyisoprenoid-binding protein YceI
MSTAMQSTLGSTWQIDPVHSTAQFKVKHMMISNVRGEFTAVRGALELDEADLTKSKVQAFIEAKTINTRDAQRDAHLKSADFLDAGKFPDLFFKSMNIRKKTEGELLVTGELSLRGVTREVVFEVEGPTEPHKDPYGNMRIGISASARINRKDFGLNWNTALEAGGFLVGDEVAITLDVEFVRA